MIDEIELVRRSKVRRAKLYFVREQAAKEIRKKMRRVMDTKYPDEVIATDVVKKGTKVGEKAEVKEETKVEAK